MKDKFILVISSCEKYSDLWDIHINLLNKNWIDRDVKTYIVSDEINDRVYDGVQIFSAGVGLEMPQRIKSILENTQSEYVLLTLDDYFLTQKIDSKKIEKAIDVMNNEKLDYLRLWPYPRSKRKMDSIKGFYWIDLDRNYQVNLYPGIWKRDFLYATFNNEYNAWMYEVSLTKTAKEYGAKCALSLNKEFPVLDVIRKGKILHKAKRFLDKEGLSLDREVISRKQEIKLNIMYYAKEYLPKSLLKLAKDYLKRKGHNFFSDGI